MSPNSKQAAKTHRHASVMLDANAFIAATAAMTCREVGEMIIALCNGIQSADEAALSMPFFGRYYVGKRTRRIDIPLPVRRALLSAGKCFQCEATERLEIDHIKPVSKGGTNDVANLQVLCKPCNLRKSNR